MTGGLQAHHVSRGTETLAPERDDGHGTQVAQNRSVRLPQLVTRFQTDHHLPDTVGADARCHAHEVRRCQVRPERHQGRVDRDQLLL